MSAIKSVRSVVPLLDRILVQRLKAKTVTQTGIYLPENNVEKLNEGEVLAVGPGIPDKNGTIIPPTVQPGDKVLIPQFGGNTIKIGDDEYLLLRNTEILAKLA